MCSIIRPAPKPTLHPNPHFVIGPLHLLGGSLLCRLLLHRQLFLLLLPPQLLLLLPPRPPLVLPGGLRRSWAAEDPKLTGGATAGGSATGGAAATLKPIPALPQLPTRLLLRSLPSARLLLLRTQQHGGQRLRQQQGSRQGQLPPLGVVDKAVAPQEASPLQLAQLMLGEGALQGLGFRDAEGRWLVLGQGALQRWLRRVSGWCWGKGPAEVVAECQRQKRGPAAAGEG